MKKLLSLILTLALLSTLFVFGATSAQAAVATQTGEVSYATEGYVHIKEAVSSKTQTICYNVEDTADNENYDNLNNFATSGNKYWSLLKFNIGDYSEIDSIVLKLTAQRNSFASIRVYSLSKADYETAIADTVNGKKTLSEANGDTLLTAPKGTYITETDYPSSKENSFSTFNIDLTNEAIKEAALSDGSVYLALGAGYKTSDAKTATIRTPFYSNEGSRPALIVTGAKVIGGLGTKIIAEKTKKVWLNEAAVNLDSAVVNGVYGKKICNNDDVYVNMMTAKDTNNNAGPTKISSSSTFEYPYHRILLLKGDISEVVGKNIEKVTLTMKGKQYKSGGLLKIYKVGTDWIEDSVTYDTAPTGDTVVDFDGFNSTEKTLTRDITSLVNENDTILGIRIQLSHNSASNNHRQGAAIYGVGGTASDSPYITITYREDLAKNEAIQKGKAFTFQAETTATGAQVMLLVAIYDAEGNIINVEASPVLTVGTAELVEEVKLADYPNAVSVAGYFWDGVTLEPYMEATLADVA